VYTHGRRFAQFWHFVRSLTTLRYEYYEGADAERIVRLCRSARVDADDDRSAADATAEDVVVAKMLSGQWDQLGRWQEPHVDRKRRKIQRRVGLRWIDGARRLFTQGDR
jgi:hypothetical protein